MPGIVGIITAPQTEDAPRRLSAMIRCMLHESFYTHGTYLLPELGCYLGWVNHPNTLSDCNPIVSRSGDRVLIFSGEHLTPHGSAAVTGGPNGYDEASAADLLSLYERRGENFLLDLNGWFAGVLIDLRQRTVLLFNDRFGVHRVYYHQTKDSFVFSSEAKSLLRICPETRSLDARALGEFLGFGTVFETRTLFTNISRLPGGSSWLVQDPSRIRKRRYFDVSTWEQLPVLADEDLYSSLKGTLSRILPKYFRSKPQVAVSLTGGIDTRLIMAGRPEHAEFSACYTYGGLYRDCFDIDAARAVAAACGLRHHVIPLGPDFFENFPALAERTIWLTDGGLDICGSHELYFSQRARQIAPVRLTGNYGSEILRSVSTFKYTAPSERLFDADVAQHLKDAVASFSDISATHPVTFAAFKEIPWNLHGRLAAAESQLIVRSPYMDNDLVSLVYQASPELRQTNTLSLRLISEMSPSLARIGTDMGYVANGSGLRTALRRLHRFLLFKAEWYYNAGMPDWLSRFDRYPLAAGLARHIVGTHKIEHYRLWFRDQLFDYIQSMLSDASTTTRPYLNQRSYRELVLSHKSGTGNRLNAINRLVTLELVNRLLIERDYRTGDHSLDVSRQPSALSGKSFLQSR